MSRFLVPCCLSLMFLASAANAQSNSAELTETRELRKLIEEQSRQIENLSHQLARIEAALALPRSPAPPPAGPPPDAHAVPAPERAKESLKPEGAKPEGSKPEAKPEGTDSGAKHVVEKGETLTSIAKHYNISVVDLQKVNKIENDRKLQIGQALIIPVSKPPEP